MTITIEIIHGTGDAPAEPVVDPLINSDAVARARGHAELDANGPNKKNISATGPYTGWLQPGLVLTLREHDTGDRVGVLDSFEIHGQVTSDGVTLDEAMEVECVEEIS